MNKIIKEIKKELKENIDLEYKESVKRFFKKEDREKAKEEGYSKSYGVRTPVVRKISKKYFREVKNLSKDKIIDLCNELLESGYSEERGIAFDWAYQMRDSYEKSDFNLFKSWLEKYVHSWGSCDGLCGGAFGEFILQFPEFISDVRKWTKSKNRWFRRASAVIMIISVRKKKHLDTIFEIADLLLLDEEDLVQKGYGWMLKEASNKYPEEVFNYVMKHKKNMPRTALRYAIEKLSPERKKKAMKRD
jgi:3-methyladenine DNA glycosylase AlkD